jgi:uncharacterized ferritin-like protein (DUF455 family)
MWPAALAIPEIVIRQPATDLAGAAPRAGTIEAWALELVLSSDLESKLAPRDPPVPQLDSSWCDAGFERRLSAPGRPATLRLVARGERTKGAEALRRPEERARLLHTFAHHELQAAELFAWAILAFPRAPRAFRAGLLRLCLEELSHLRLYAAHMRTLGLAYGDLPVRDWFWSRVAACRDPLAFVALQGLGLEGANLEHSARFAALFRAAGDEAGAKALELVERDEIGHVAFARYWFERFSGASLDFQRWELALPPPLTPALFRGTPLNRSARAQAGMDQRFLDALEATAPASSPSPRRAR